jgi:glycine/D-amino acid oxidase-like deaminating enzyme
VSRSGAHVAVAGAGVYGATVAVRLAALGHQVDLYDPLGVLQAASAINQYRVHSGYHYPRSDETIVEVLSARDEFLKEYADAIVRATTNYYAIPREGSLTAPEAYEDVMARHGLPLRRREPPWMDFDFIDRCYEVEESTYDPDLLRDLLHSRLERAGVHLHREPFPAARRAEYDFVVHATYGLGPSRAQFSIAKYQVAEKILIQLPEELQHVALVVVDGPFTAFDPYGASARSLFGSARHTNHWTTTDPDEPVPEKYRRLLNRPTFEPCDFTNFEQMRAACALTAPAAASAVYLGSRFTLRVVEDSPADDRRVLYVKESEPGELHIFSGKVVSAVKAARIVGDLIEDRR